MVQGYVVTTGARDEVIPLFSIYDYDKVTIGTDTPKHKLGDKCRMSDGRVYHIALNGAVTLTASRLLQNSVTPIGHRNMACPVLSAIGETHVHITPVTTDTIKNEYSNGYLWMNAGAGVGIMYKIKSNPVIVASANGVVELYDPLVVATAVATSKVSMVRNPWFGTLVMPTGITGIPVGVNPIAIPATTSTIEYYFWCQTWGPATVLAGGTQVITTPWCAPGTRAGGVIVQATAGVPTVGMFYNSLQVTDNENMAIFLQISQ